jgi:N-acyl-D-aspartate/D-glutamate deacylase
MHDLVIRGGTIVDGSGNPRFTGDIAIDQGRITAVGQVTHRARGDRRQRPDRHARLCRYPHPL